MKSNHPMGHWWNQRGNEKKNTGGQKLKHNNPKSMECSKSSSKEVSVEWYKTTSRSKQKSLTIWP